MHHKLTNKNGIYTEKKNKKQIKTVKQIALIDA